MKDDIETKKGPLLGEPAPNFETTIAGNSISLKDFKAKWVIILSHPEDLLPLFRTRTVNYVLCKRRTKVIALGNGDTSGIDTGKNLIKKYILKHNLTIVDDTDKRIAACYGLPGQNSVAPEGEKGVFIIDPKGVLRVKLYLPQAAERNFYEILRLIDALQAADRKKVRGPSKRAWRRGLDIVIGPRGATGQEQT